MDIKETLLNAANSVVNAIVLDEFKTSAKSFKREVYFGRGQPAYTQKERDDIPYNFYYALKQVLEENGYELTRYSYSKTTPISFECKTKY